MRRAGSAAARSICSGSLRLEPCEQLPNLEECAPLEGVVRPAAVAPVGDEAGILEDLQVIGEARLAGLERVSQIADAFLTIEESRDDLDARLVGKGVTELRDARNVECCSSHVWNVLKFFDQSRCSVRRRQNAA